MTDREAQQGDWLRETPALRHRGFSSNGFSYPTEIWHFLRDAEQPHQCECSWYFCLSSYRSITGLLRWNSLVNHCNATEELLQGQICKFWGFLQYCLPTSFLVVKNRAAGSIFWRWVLQFHHSLQKYSQNASLLNSVCKYMQHWINFCKSPHQNTDPTHSCALKQAGHPGDHHMHLAMAFPDSAEA